MLPDGWKAAELEDLASFHSGGTPSRSTPEFWGGNFPWISAKDLKNHFISDSIERLSDAGSKNAAVAPSGSSLVLVRGMTLLKRFPVGFASRPVAFNQDVKALLPKKNTDPLFLSFLLAAESHKIRQMVSTAGHGTGRLDTTNLKEYPVLLPPLPEQKKIAAILLTWDRTIEGTEKLLANSQQQKKALMQQLLTGKERLSGFTGEWKTKTFLDLFILKIGGTPSRSNSSYWDPDKSSNNRWVAISDLKKAKITSTAEHISDLGVKNSNCSLIPKGTIILSFKLTIGKKAILQEDCYTNEAICALIIKDNKSTYTKYIYQALDNVNYEEEIDQAVKGKTLNKEKLARLRIPFPPLPEQQAIAAVLSTADEEITAIESDLSRLRQEKKALMQQLLTGKRRVTVD